MRHLAIAILAAIGSLLLWSGSAVARTCGSPKGHDLLATPEGRVYSLAEGKTFYACLSGQVRPVRLRPPHLAPPKWHGPSIEIADLAPPYVAYVWTYVAIELRSSGLVVTNLEHPGMTWRYPAVTPSSVTQNVTSLYLSPSGTIAWAGIGWMDALGGAPEIIQIVKGDRGRTSVLDEGSGVAYESFSLVGRHLSWIDLGRERRAPFP